MWYFVIGLVVGAVIGICITALVCCGPEDQQIKVASAAFFNTKCGDSLSGKRCDQL